MAKIKIKNKRKGGRSPSKGGKDSKVRKLIRLARSRKGKKKKR